MSMYECPKCGGTLVCYCPAQPSPATPDPQDRLIDAAEAYAEKYDGDDRQDIKTDVLNAFYQGAAHAEAQALQEAHERIFDMLLADDGQAYKEARRYLERAAPELAARLDAKS